jgi:hypothetical protein
MSKGQSLQDPYLNALRRDRIPVSIYLVSGIKLQGPICHFVTQYSEPNDLQVCYFYRRARTQCQDAGHARR